MLEILLLISFTRKIATLATQKGQKPGTWKLYVVLAWFGTELTGGVIGYMIFGGGNYMYMLPAYAFAIGSYFLLRYKLRQMPDTPDDWISQIGEDVTELPAE